jgi:NAD(P)-dependent dehydrogenase (short-subunit alcohol dehydrogenase family)
MIHKLIGFSSRLIQTAKAVRKCWRNGGATQINIAQINHGAILKDKRVLITGGSSGIGLAIAKKCLAEGATVVITGRNEAKLQTVAGVLNNPLLKTLVWDVSSISQREEKLDEALRLVGGGLDVLVNNAGILLEQSFFTATEDVWDKTYAVNSKGVFFLTQKVGELWIKNKQPGKIINMSSTGGILGAPYPYRMTKWDIIGLTAGLGQTLSPYGIIVNGIAPGRIATEMLDRNSTDNIYDTFQPVRRMGLPEEIAELAVFLMSDAANYIVGQTIICDGGYTLKV